MLTPAAPVLEVLGTLAILPIGGEVGAIGKLKGLGLAKTAAQARKASGIWSLGWGARGLKIEELLGGNLPPAFLTIDRYVGGVAASIKSVDLLLPTYQNGSRLKTLLTGYIEKLAGFTRHARAGVEIGGAANPITQKVLEIAVPAVRWTVQQERAFAEAAALAAQNNIKLTIIIVP
jgi:hypothetical protein